MIRRQRWHIERDGNTLTLARRLPARFDLSVRAHLPLGSRLRVAQQIRQDIWRALQNLRGFAPVVRVVRSAGNLEITAGGQVDGRFAKAKAEAKIAEVLENPANRARWMKWAT